MLRGGSEQIAAIEGWDWLKVDRHAVQFRYEARLGYGGFEGGRGGEEPGDVGE